MWPEGWSNGTPGVLHQYGESLMAFEFATGAVSKPDTLILIGGLGDGVGTIGFTSALVESLAQSSWSLLSPRLSSSYSGWGVGSLDQDVAEIAKCVTYIQERKQSGNVAIMGHSTGSQDVLHYLISPAKSSTEESRRPMIDGAILQAAVSDREAMRAAIEEDLRQQTPKGLQKIYTELVDLARHTASLEGDHADKLLPLSMTSALGYGKDTPVSARRFLSLVSPDSPARPAEDDLFSSDLDENTLKQTFGDVGNSGRLRGTLLVLLSGEDDAYPDDVDPGALLGKWQRVTDHVHQHQVWNREFSGVIAGASHGLSEEEQGPARKELARRVMGYLKTFETNIAS